MIIVSFKQTFTPVEQYAKTFILFLFLRIRLDLPKDYNHFFRLPPILPIFAYAANGACHFGRNIGVTFSFSSNLLLLLSKIHDPPEKISGKLALDSLFRLSVFYIITKR